MITTLADRFSKPASLLLDQVDGALVLKPQLVRWITSGCNSFGSRAGFQFRQSEAIINKREAAEPVGDGGKPGALGSD
jgi:hypothetical protein